MNTDITALKSKSRGISLGMLAADLGNLREAAKEAASWRCDILHFDVMDGEFVAGMTAGPGFVKALDIGALRDVHLMIKHPAQHVASYVKAGADIITVHAESEGAAEAIKNIRSAASEVGRPVLAGLGIMPGTSLQEINELLAMKPDMILVLSLDPRSKNPPDITTACTRLSELRERLGPSGPLLAFDGGVTLDSIAEIAACLPDMIVSGSAVLGANNPKDAFTAMAQAHQPNTEI